MQLFTIDLFFFLPHLKYFVLNFICFHCQYFSYWMNTLYCRETVSTCRTAIKKKILLIFFRKVLKVFRKKIIWQKATGETWRGEKYFWMLLVFYPKRLTHAAETKGSSLETAHILEITQMFLSRIASQLMVRGIWQTGRSSRAQLLQ